MFSPTVQLMNIDASCHLTMDKDLCLVLLFLCHGYTTEQQDYYSLCCFDAVKQWLGGIFGALHGHDVWFSLEINMGVYMFSQWQCRECWILTVQFVAMDEISDMNGNLVWVLWQSKLSSLAMTHPITKAQRRSIHCHPGLLALWLLCLEKLSHCTFLGAGCVGWLVDKGESLS